MSYVGPGRTSDAPNVGRGGGGDWRREADEWGIHPWEGDLPAKDAASCHGGVVRRQRIDQRRRDDAKATVHGSGAMTAFNEGRRYDRRSTPPTHWHNMPTADVAQPAVGLQDSWIVAAVSCSTPAHRAISIAISRSGRKERASRRRIRALSDGVQRRADKFGRSSNQNALRRSRRRRRATSIKGKENGH